MIHKTLVEVSVPGPDGTMIPYGIMNSDQAADLPESYEILLAHPASSDHDDQEFISEYS